MAYLMKVYRRFLHGPPISKTNIRHSTYRFTSSKCSGVHAQSSTLPLHVIDTHNSSSKAMPWKGGTATRAIVPREWDDQNATSLEHSNQRKKRPFPNLLFFLQSCGQRKAATDPPYSGLTIAKQQKVVPLVASSL